jgi:methyl-accepting chemotaxis protein
MQARLRELVGDIHDCVNSMQAAITEVAGGNLDLSGRTEQAATNLQRTASSMEELTMTVQRSANGATQANRLAADAFSIALRGGEVVARVVEAMGEINASSTRIGDFTAVIDGLAFQSNILALNAAFEAARAGEQGRAFSVLVGEVRSLAGRCATAEREIKQIIASPVMRVEAGWRLVADAGVALREIVRSVGRVGEIVRDHAVLAWPVARHRQSQRRRRESRSDYPAERLPGRGLRRRRKPARPGHAPRPHGLRVSPVGLRRPQRARRRRTDARRAQSSPRTWRACSATPSERRTRLSRS